MFSKILLLLSIKFLSTYGDGTYSDRDDGTIFIQGLVDDKRQTFQTINMKDRQERLSEPIEIGNYRFEHLRVIEADIDLAPEEASTILFEFRNNVKESGLSFSMHYRQRCRSKKDFGYISPVTPMCNFFVCEAGFFYSDPVIKGNDIYNGTKPIDYAFYLTYKSPSNNGFVMYRIPYNDFWFPMTYIPSTNWASGNKFVKNIIPDYVKDTAVEPVNIKNYYKTIAYGPVWPVVNGDRSFTATTLNQRETGPTDFKYELVKDDTLTPIFGMEIGENPKDLDTCIDQNGEKMDDRPEASYFIYYYNPTIVHDGKPLMKKYSIGDEIHPGGALLYYRKNCKVFDDFGPYSGQKHKFPKCVRKINENYKLPTRTNPPPVEETVKTNPPPVEETVKTDPPPVEKDVETEPHPIEKDLLIDPKEGDVFSINEMYPKKKNVLIGCAKDLGKIGDLQKVDVVHTEEDPENNSVCEDNADNEFGQNKLSVKFINDFANNTQIVCTYKTPSGVTFTIKKNVAYRE
uniref:ZP domain-containing protein n=1 Tax=Strongyloides papillosus TaxID=174720 RepID=A0A0N5CF10_STREA